MKEEYMYVYDGAKLNMSESDLTINRTQGEDYSLLTELVLTKSNENVYESFDDLDSEQ